MDISCFPSCQHEPFKHDRKLGYIYQNFCQSNYQDVAGLQKVLENDVCQNQTLIKHCYEIPDFNPKFSKVLLKTFDKAGYKHIFLYRENEFARLMSLMVARSTKIWDRRQGSEEYYKKVIGGEIKMDRVEVESFEKTRRNSRTKTQEILEMFKEEEITPFWVSYDSLYSASASTKLITWRSLFNFLGFDYDEEVKKRPKFFEENIDKNSQKSQTIYQYIPNWEELEKKREVCNRDFKDMLANYSNNQLSNSEKRQLNMAKKTPNSLNFDSLLVVTYGRSGSTLLQGILNSIDGILIKGENMNFIEGLYVSYQRLCGIKAKEITSPQQPWYGCESIDINLYLKNCKKLIRDVLIGELSRENRDRVKCYGFKEIRYCSAEGLEGENWEILTQALYWKNLRKNHIYIQKMAEYLDFLAKVFPNPCFIFNTRNLDAVSESGWWKDFEKAKVKEILQVIEGDMNKYVEKHPENCFKISYEDIVEKSERLKLMFGFLGVEYSESKVQEILSLPHSYGHKSFRINKSPNNEIQSESNLDIDKKAQEHIDDGNKAVKLKEYNQAVASYKKAIELNSSQPPWVYRHLVNSLVKLSKFDEAKAVCNFLVENYPDKPVGYARLAKISMELQHWELALEMWNTCISKFPSDDFWFQVNKGNTLIELGRLEEAKLIFQQLNETYPDKNQGIKGIGRIENLESHQSTKTEDLRIPKQQFVSQEQINQSQSQCQFKLFWERQKYILNHQYRFVYCPIPKNASSSFKTLAIQLSNVQNKDEKILRDVHKYAQENFNLAKEGENAYQILNGNDYFKFVVVRNPWKRLVSAYVEKFVNNRIRSFTQMKKIKHKDTITAIYKHKGLQVDYEKSISFREFLDYLKFTPDEELNVHWKPQYLFLGNNRFDYILKLENIANDFEYLQKKLKISLSLPQRNKTNYVQTSQEKQEKDLDYSVLYPSEFKGIKIPSYQEFYTSELVELVKERYREDISRFNYHEEEKLILEQLNET
ncbi:sulfotransferase family 2 domain-containing protein [Okeania sp. SIO3B5]|uniref:sulfotransferase family 2 domain-containing protein n=1 Tax=Okeania sp. SIO3B5 TaxID=2607811 RepID=UPI0025E8DB54|nr:sulfotransferase family 2 domain-containing protein [Okeania sp. SIO3B5]